MRGWGVGFIVLDVKCTTRLVPNMIDVQVCNYFLLCCTLLLHVKLVNKMLACRCNNLLLLSPCWCVAFRWSSISRRERYRKRCEDNGDEVVDEENVLPGAIDPITLEPVVNPAISPYGHVMGLATWKAVLAEQQRCPFTKQALRVEQLVVLNQNNIERHRDRIVHS